MLQLDSANGMLTFLLLAGDSSSIKSFDYSMVRHSFASPVMHRGTVLFLDPSMVGFSYREHRATLQCSKNNLNCAGRRPSVFCAQVFSSAPTDVKAPTVSLNGS